MRRHVIARFAAVLLGALPLCAMAQTPPQPVFLSVTINGSKITGVGTGAGTVAAGNDARIVGAIQGPLSTALDAAFGSTQGGILYRGASAWALLGPGSSGQVLGSGGANANPSWVTPAGGTTGTQSPNSVLAGPASGAAAAPGYRALVAADVPFSAPVTAYDGRAVLALSGTSATSGATLVLSPLAGNGVIVNGAVVTIPDAGLSLASSGLAASTLYYVYLTSAAALEASATAPVVQAGTGLKIKGGASGATDPTRRLVGMALTGSNGYFYSSSSYRYVRSYFNDPGVIGSVSTSSDVSQTSNASNAVASCIALMWAGENATAAASGRVSSGAANGSANLQAGVGGTAIGPYSGGQSYGAGAVIGAASVGNYTAPSDGQYTFQILFSSDGSNTGRLLSGAQVSVTTNGNGVK